MSELDSPGGPPVDGERKPPESAPGSTRQGFLAGLTTVAVLAALVSVLTWVDLSPKVESDFFFATDDPQLRASQKIGDLFPAREQLLVSAMAPDITTQEYADRIAALTEELLTVPGVADVQSLTRGPSNPKSVPESPLWSRLLLGASPNQTQLIVSVAEPADSAIEGEAAEEGAAERDAAEGGAVEGRELVDSIDAALANHHRASFALDVSGVPYVVELIRRSLEKDLKIFSSAAVVIFGLLIALVYRSPWLVGGSLLTCLGACAVTLTALSLLGSHIGLLTANIITIVFVLTLSHLVFLIANWRSQKIPLDGTEGGELVPEAGTDPVARAVALTRPASIWCMTTTLLGFASLLLADAKPLRELGFAGAVGTLVALLVAYGLFPTFLRRASSTPGAMSVSGPAPGQSAPARPGVSATVRFLLDRGALATALLLLAAAIAAFGVPRLDTDPNLLSYFEPGSRLRGGLERIDRSGGSSPLLFVVSDPQGESLDSDANLQRLGDLQTAFDGSPDVGTAISLPVLLQEAKRAPMAFLLNWRQLLTILESERFDNVARGLITEDHQQSLLFLRMRESDRHEPRRQVIEELEAEVAQAGLRADLVGGLFELQASLGELVASSLARGLGGLLLLFVVIAGLVSGRLSEAMAMIVSLAAVPILLLGSFGFAGQPLDLISSPAANVAIALGIDSMIHLVSAVRRERGRGQGTRGAWEAALMKLLPAIAGATLILAAGFGIFALSSFPPTQRFGVAVALGTVAAATLAVVALPFLARIGRASEPSNGGGA